MSRVLMLLTNAFKPDTRVLREAQALTGVGHQVTIICWDRRAEMEPREDIQGVTVVRVQDVLSEHGAGPRQILRIPRFWARAIQMAGDLRPDVVHCHDLDTLYAGWRLKRPLGCRLVYDAHENYPSMMSLYLPGIMVRGLGAWEHWLMRRADAIITASTVLRDEFAPKVSVPLLALGNHQDLGPYQAVTPAEVAQARTDLGIGSDDLAIGYVGGFSQNRALLPFVQAASLAPDVQFHLWGDGSQRAAIEAALSEHPNAHYHGWLQASDLPVTFKALDMIYYCLRGDFEGAVYNAPNTLSQAMAAGRPIIATDVGDLGRIVRAERCGKLVEMPTPQAIAGAILELRDAPVRRQLGANGLRAAEERYNLDAVAEQLAALYERLQVPNAGHSTKQME